MSGTIFVFVQHQPFQLRKLPQGDLEKNATGNKRRKNCGKVNTDDEPGFEDCSKIFNGAKFECIELPRSTQSKLESYSSCGETCS